MKDWPWILEKYFMNQPGLRPNERKSHVREVRRIQDRVQQVMESQAQIVRAAVPRLKMKPYVVANGHKAETRLKCSAPGFKKMSIYPDLDPGSILCALIPNLIDLLPMDPSVSLIAMHHDARTVLREADRVEIVHPMAGG